MYLKANLTNCIRKKIFFPAVGMARTYHPKVIIESAEQKYCKTVVARHRIEYMPTAAIQNDRSVRFDDAKYLGQIRMPRIQKML